MNRSKEATRIVRREAETMESLVGQYVKAMGLTSGMNSHRVYGAWDAVSGAAAYTIGRQYRGGVLYVTVSSSVVRSQLWMQREAIRELVNDRLKEDNLFDQSKGLVKEIVLR